MITDGELQLFFETDKGKKMFQQLALQMERMKKAVERSETFGHFGWAFPLDMEPRDYVRLAEHATNADTVDAAFLKYYTDHDGQAYKRLICSVIDEPELQQCRGFLEEVRQSYDDSRYRVCVAALLPMLDHIAQRTWDAPLSTQGKAHKSLERNIGVLPDSLTDYLWRSLKAFVDQVFVRSTRSKPPVLNRHWILHGRGISDGTQVDCLRLLQAIRLLEELAVKPTDCRMGLKTGIRHSESHSQGS